MSCGRQMAFNVWEIFLLQNLTIDDDNFGQSWWWQKWNKGYHSSRPVMASIGISGLNLGIKHYLLLLLSKKHSFVKIIIIVYYLLTWFSIFKFFLKSWKGWSQCFRELRNFIISQNNTTNMTFCKSVIFQTAN